MEELSLPSFNVAPFDRIPVLHDREADRRVTVRPFGVRRQGRVHLNGRIESLSERPMFRPHLMSGRVVIPMSGWYEWTKSVQASLNPITCPTRSASALVAGLLLPEGAGHGVILIRAPADQGCRAIHERMPHVLDGPHAEAWLGAGSMPEPVLESIEVELFIRCVVPSIEPMRPVPISSSDSRPSSMCDDRRRFKFPLGPPHHMGWLDPLPNHLAERCKVQQGPDADEPEFVLHWMRTRRFASRNRPPSMSLGPSPITSISP